VKKFFILHSSFKLCEAQFIGRAASLHKKSPPMEGFFISLASGYPLHHPLARSAHRGWFRFYPSRCTRRWREYFFCFVKVETQCIASLRIICVINFKLRKARGIVAEPPNRMNEMNAVMVMERIARREASEASRSGSPNLTAK
jgi:hypothetical protein